jgi:hypothetical protein
MQPERPLRGTGLWPVACAIVRASPAGARRQEVAAGVAVGVEVVYQAERVGGRSKYQEGKRSLSPARRADWALEENSMEKMTGVALVLAAPMNLAGEALTSSGLGLVEIQ